MAKNDVEVEEIIEDEYEEFDEVRQAMIDAAIEELGDDVVDAIRAEERQMIIDFIMRIENVYECGEDLVEMIEQLDHYDNEEIH